MNSLSFGQLARLNKERCEDVFHEISSWTPTDWACALSGEVGEACNKIKKLRRLIPEEFYTWDELVAQIDQDYIDDIVEEIADVVIYADLLVQRFHRSLGDAVIRKFNKVSEKRGSDIKI